MKWCAVTVCVFLALGFAVTASAQQSPTLTTDLSEDSVAVGQPTELRLNILVPTWLPNPPIFPAVEVPGLLVRRPERSGGPISERVGGETWSGVSRVYSLYPLQAGTFTLPPQKIVVTYADPETTQPIKTDLTVPEIRFQAVVPAGAQDVDPLIVARGFTLEQIVEGGPDLNAGDAVVRTVTATIDGTTPIMIPLLIPDPVTIADTENDLTQDSETPPVRAYPSEPKVSETDAREGLLGSRVESVTYVAQAGGQTTLPRIAFDWFNLDSGSVETAVVDEVALSVAAAPAGRADPRSVVRIGLILLGAALLLALALRYLRPRLRHAAQALRDAWLLSEPHAHHEVLTAFRTRKLTNVYTALDRWQSFHPQMQEADLKPLMSGLADLGQGSFGLEKRGQARQDWTRVTAIYQSVRRKAKRATRTARTAGKLPALNP